MRIKHTEDTKYYQVSKSLIECEKIIDKRTGEEIAIDPYFKLVFMRLRDQYVYRNNKGEQYFESAEVIGSYVGISETKVKRVIKLIRALGLIEDVGKKSRANIMIVHDLVSVEHLEPVGKNLKVLFDDKKVAREKFVEEKKKEVVPVTVDKTYVKGSNPKKNSPDLVSGDNFCIPCDTYYYGAICENPLCQEIPF